MSYGWTITNRGTSGTAASASRASPTSASSVGQQTRLRSFQCTLSGTAAGTDQLVIRDGASGSGTIIAQFDLSVAANGNSIIALSGLDLRASVGNSLTIEFVNGVTSDTEDVNAQGDFIPAGYPMFAT